MAFNSYAFLFLVLPLALALFLLTPARLRAAFLVAASLFLYYWSEGRYAAILPVVILALFLATRRFGRGPRGGKAAFALTLGLLLLLLAYFKYGGFLAENVNSLRALFSLPRLRLRPIHLPLGISFFLFSAISCLVDCRRAAAAAGRPALRSIALYIAFFPKLLTGPLVPFRRFAELEAGCGVTATRLRAGIRRFILGLGKKVLVADALARAANGVFSLPAAELDLGLAWIGLAAFALQIYFDFSGYSDMAIGLGAVFGFDLPENFRHPFWARSLRDFWSRWHITLSQWFRDYLFLPVAYRILGRLPRERYLGVRTESWSYAGATVLTMLLCGLWHGAGWGFALWGLYHAAFLLLEHAGWEKRLKRAARPWGHLYALLAVSGGWVLFRSPTPAYAGAFFRALLGLGRGEGALYFPALFVDREVLVAAAVALAGSVPLLPWLGERLRRTLRPWSLGHPRLAGASLATARLAFLALVAALSTLAIAGGSYQPFLYLRF
jgi:alginate O-acetyltransferase complex protein AlgI